MSKIIDFKKPLDKEAQKLVDLGAEIDRLVLAYVGMGLDLYEVGGVLSHRLGEVVRNLPKENIDQALDIYVDIILKRADQPNG